MSSHYSGRCFATFVPYLILMISEVGNCRLSGAYVRHGALLDAVWTSLRIYIGDQLRTKTTLSSRWLLDENPKMGTMLSLPLLVLPSVGTVSCSSARPACGAKLMTYPTVSYVRGVMLWSGYMFSSL